MNYLSLFSIFVCISTAQYSTFPDLEYGEFSRNKLDLYLPSSNSFSPPFPLVIYIHGGNWSAGDKSDAFNNHKVPTLTANGIAIASMNYRYSTESLWNAQLLDFLSAVDYLSSDEFVESYEIDTTRFAVWGDGEGAQIGLMGALSAENRSQYNARIIAAVTYFGVFDLYQLQADRDADSIDSPGITGEAEEILLGLERTEENKDAFDSASPLKLVENLTVGEPLPVQYFHLAHGINDPIVPIAQTTDFYFALQTQAGSSNVLISLLQGGHGGEEFDSQIDFSSNFLLEPLEVEDLGFNVFPDLIYSSEEYQVLDIYQPKDALSQERFPILMYVHGGDWQHGDKSQVLDYDLIKEAMKRRYVVVSLNFGSAPDVSFSSMIDAQRFLVSNVDEYKLDTSRCALWGQGSGAHLAIFAGLLQDVIHIASIRISAVVSWFGYTDLFHLIEDFENDLVLQKPPYVEFIPSDDPDTGSPIEKMIGESLIPSNRFEFNETTFSYLLNLMDEDVKTCDFILTTGTEDAIVSPLQTLRFFKGMKERNSSQYLATRIVEGAAHGGTEFFDETIVSLDFISQSFGLGEFDWEDYNDNIEKILTGADGVSDEGKGTESDQNGDLFDSTFFLSIALGVSFIISFSLVIKVLRENNSSVQTNSVAVDKTA
eukprot:snap_masked-scaffold_4-processed-gene-6.13-mRNA-1 protein AED:1.00 eAED:1.00 QI:0/0/0/0/1/1/2/0/654